MTNYSTGQFPLAESKGVLTVKSSALRHLAERVNTRDEMLIFVWGRQHDDHHAGWSVASCLQAELPGDTGNRGVQGIIASTPFLVAHAEHIWKLDGCTLALENGVLTVVPQGAPS